MWASASARRVSGGIGTVGGSWPGRTQANNGSLRHSAWPSGDAWGLTGSSYHVPGGGGFCASSCSAWATDLSTPNAVVGSGPAKLITKLLPVTVSPIGSHRHGGGGMSTGLCARRDQLPLNLTRFS